MRISSSKMDLFYLWCKRKYKLKYVEYIKIPFTSQALILGKECHDEIDLFWEEFELNLTTYKEDLEKYYNIIIKKLKKKLIEQTFINFQRYFGNFIYFQGVRIDNYLYKHGENYETIKSYFYPIISEKYGKFEIIKNTQFSFIIDALFKTDYGNLLIDWKSDEECTRTQFLTHKPQLNRYSRSLPKIGYSCKKLGIYFLKESKTYTTKTSNTYSLEREIIKFLKDLQKNKFPKVKKEENWKCCAEKYQCEYFPDICSGSF